VSIEVAVGARLASVGSLAAVEECRVCGVFSELKPYNSESKKGRSAYTELAGGTDNGNHC
jgi:hypothetical protein